MTQNQEIKEKKKKSRKSKLLFLVFIVFCLGAVALTALDEFGSSRDAEKIPLSSLNFNYLFAAFGAFAVLVLSESAKYYFLIKGTTGESHPLIAYNAAVLGKYYDNITPLGAGGQPFQMVYLSKHGLSNGNASAIPIAGFFGLQISFVLIAVVCFILNPCVTDIVALRIAAYVGLIAYLAVPTVMLLFSLWPNKVGPLIMKLVGFLGKIRVIKNPDQAKKKTENSLEEYRTSILLIWNKKALPAIVMLCSVIYQVALMSIPFFVLKAFGGTSSWFDAFTMSLYVYASITIIPTPGNSGAAEGAFYALFSSLQPVFLFWAMLVWRFFVFYAMLILGLFSILCGYLRRKYVEKLRAKEE